MRVDSYLWAVRLYKTRNNAADSLKLGRVLIDDQPIKASRTLKKGDAIEIRFTGYSRRFEVLDFPKKPCWSRALLKTFFAKPQQRKTATSER